MNYRKQGFRDRIAGEKINDCPYEIGTYAASAYRAGWRDADNGEEESDPSDSVSVGPRKVVGVQLSESQRAIVGSRAESCGMTIAAYMRDRALS